MMLLSLILLPLGLVLMLKPAWVIKHSGNPQLRAGGEMRKKWNEMEFEVMGGLITVFAIYLLVHSWHS